MTPEQLEIVARSAAMLEERADRFGTTFYDRLFTIAPEARALFPDDLAAQRAKLVDEVVFLAEVASDLDGFLVRARELGARHRHYGVRANDYASVRIALLDALKVAMADSHTPEIDEAWSRLYDLVAEAMLEGATGELFSDV